MDNGASSYRRFLEGDNEGLAEIIREYSDGLIFYINSYVHNISLAEEIMEDVFVYIAVKRPKYMEKSSFKTWLYAIARYTSIDCLKKEQDTMILRLSKCRTYETSRIWKKAIFVMSVKGGFIR